MSPPRSFPWQWLLCLAGILVTIAVLIINAIDVRTFYEAACTPPGKLSYNLAVSVLSFFALTYLIYANNYTSTRRLWPWLLWINCALDTLMFALWLATAITSNLDCNDLCKACSSKAEFNHGNLTCMCFVSTGEPNLSPAPRSVLQVRDSKSSEGSSGKGWIGVLKQDLDIVVTILFFICLIADLYHVIEGLRNNNTTTTNPLSDGTGTAKHQKPDKATRAAEGLLQYLFHKPNVRSGSGQTPQPLIPPRYPQSAHHQQYIDSSATPQPPRTPQQGDHMEAKEGVVATQALVQPVEVDRFIQSPTEV